MLARPGKPLDVLLVARPGDLHADVVARELTRRGAHIARTSLNRLRETVLTWQPGEPLLLAERHATSTIDASTAAWWRRPGWIATDDLDPEEADLARAEGVAILRGSLRAAVGRWVDPPPLVHAAEDKLYQLHLARTLGLAVPDTLVTNDSAAARRFAAGGPLLAKAVSVGPGIAPFAAEVPTNYLDLVAACPVLLQRCVKATADLRVITVGAEVIAWSRPRAPEEPLDWRWADPAGCGFRPCPADAVAASALRLAAGLSLTFSVQDWLATPEGPVFLEVNPQGQWRFLADADRRVAPAVASLLIGR